MAASVITMTMAACAVSAPARKPFGDARPRLASPLELRPLAQADVPRAAELEAAGYPPDEAASAEQLAYRAARAPDYFYGLYDGDALVGFVVGTCYVGTDGALDESTMSSHDESGDGPLTLCVHSVVVEAARRRAGLGRAMVCEYVERIARGASTRRVARILLITKPANLGLYASCGFSLVGRSSVVHGAEPWYEMALRTAHARAQPFVQVDAFTGQPFCGNPAAVLFTQRGGDAAWMQRVAEENNLAETAFVEPAGALGADGACDAWSLRWFTPALEVGLCLHATVGAAHALWHTRRAPAGRPLSLRTRSSGELLASQLADGWVSVELAAPALTPCAADAELRAKAADLDAELVALLAACGVREPAPRARADALVGPPSCRELLLVLSAAEWAQLADVPDLAVVRAVTARLGLLGVILTVEGDGCAGTAHAERSRMYARAAGGLPALDFTSRFFAPAAGVDEDPVTGSAHALLGPFWAERKGLPPGARMHAYQASRRGGLVRVAALEGGARVRVEGEAVVVLEGQLLDELS